LTLKSLNEAIFWDGGSKKKAAKTTPTSMRESIDVKTQWSAMSLWFHPLKELIIP
jgi:hypothetical protein